MIEMYAIEYKVYFFVVIFNFELSLYFNFDKFNLQNTIFSGNVFVWFFRSLNKSNSFTLLYRQIYHFQ